MDPGTLNTPKRHASKNRMCPIRTTEEARSDVDHRRVNRYASGVQFRIGHVVVAVIIMAMYLISILNGWSVCGFMIVEWCGRERQRESGCRKGRYPADQGG